MKVYKEVTYSDINFKFIQHNYHKYSKDMFIDSIIHTASGQWGRFVLNNTIEYRTFFYIKISSITDNQLFIGITNNN